MEILYPTITRGFHPMDPVTLAAILSIPVSVTGIGAFGRWFSRFTNRLEETLKPDAQGRSISERLDDTQIVVAEIKKQVLPNGGNSLRDAVNDAAVLAKTASDNAIMANDQARIAVEKAERAEIVGNFERRDIRKKLDDIDKKIDTSAGVLTAHLLESAATSATVNNRLDHIEQTQQRSA